MGGTWVINWGSLPDWVVAITAVVGVSFGLRQLRALRQTNYETAQFERAKLMLEIDRDFESSQMIASRHKLLAIRNRFESEVEKSCPQMTSDEQIAEVSTRISNFVTQVWRSSRTYDNNPDADKDSSADEYKLIMRLPSWCETLGHQCRNNLIPLGDVLELYDQLVINTVGNLEQHIRLRSEQGPHKNARYLEHALWLYEEARAHKKQRATPVAGEHNPSAVSWKNQSKSLLRTFKSP